MKTYGSCSLQKQTLDLVEQNDDELRKRLHSLSVDNEEYWSFKGNSNREFGHGYFQYPAMMVPQLARTLLNEILFIHPDIKTVGDPFMGSGTILTESRLRGLHFWGTDINPLAVLLCKVKNSPYFIDELGAKVTSLISNIESHPDVQIDVNFKNLTKWFRQDVIIGLSKIRTIIKKESEIWIRRFYWMALCETARYTSNSRTSTFKLHTRTPEDINNKNFNPTSLFVKILSRNLQLYKSEYFHLNSLGFIDNGQYSGNVNVLSADIKSINSNARKCQLIITSPPYGDNRTTVPYGQYSYLPLQWIDMVDVDDSISHDSLSTTHAIDSASLGGKIYTDVDSYRSLFERAPSLSEYSARINGMPRDRLNRVSCFINDFNQSLPNILETLDNHGIMVWILGNRKVGGERVPFDKILTELLSSYETKLICKLVRTITSKRIALKNSLTQTMSKESILVFRKN